MKDIQKFKKAIDFSINRLGSHTGANANDRRIVYDVKTQLKLMALALSESQSVVDNEDEEKSSCSCSDLNTIYIEGYGSVIIWQIEEDDSSGR